MSTEKFVLSSDLVEILNKAKNTVLNNNNRCISTCHLVSTIINTYFKDKSTLTVVNEPLAKFVDGLPASIKEELIESFEVFDKKIKITYRIPDDVTWNNNYSIIKNSLKSVLKLISTTEDSKESGGNVIDFLLCLSDYINNPNNASTLDKEEIEAMNILNSYSIISLLQDINSYENNYDGSKSQYEKDITLKLKELLNIGEVSNNDHQDKNNENPDDYIDDQSDIDREFEMAGKSSDTTSEFDLNSKTPFLDKYSVNFNELAKNGKFDPVIGRDNEISQIIEILGCRKKKNCILTGLPGIGKTSIVQELSRRIVNGEVPVELLGKQIRSLDLTSLVSGAIYRGQSEERVMGVCKEASENPNIILYIDEIHNIIGNGSSSGNGGTDEIMKPYLSNNDGITVIGSTTDEEYRKFIEKNGAFKRRFQEVSIVEPSMEDTINILTNLVPKYEEFHKVRYTKEVIESCVEWSNQYINDRFFPDKAVDLMDISGSLTKFDRKIDTSKIENLEKSIKQIKEEKNQFMMEQDFEEASKRRETELFLTKELEKEKENYKKLTEDKSKWPEVTVDRVANIVSKLSRVPVDKIRQTSFDKLRSMKKSMETTVIGQDDAIKEITMSLNRQFMGIKDPNKPASFLMVGPTGTGKTYCAKQVAEQIFGGDKSLIRIDCSEYIEKYSVSKLLGSTAGYVGYEDEPVLLRVKRKPFSVVLFDEIEKMSEEIINTVFLPILDEGYISLANGTKVSFRNSIIIMTSNIGVKELEKKTDLGFTKLSEEENNEKDKDIIMKAIKKKFKPEVINRFGKIIFFKALGENELLKIFDLELEKLKERLSDKKLYIKVTDNMKKFIVSKCDRIYGARDLQRGIVKYVEDAICEKMISMTEKTDFGNSITVDIVDETPIVSFTSSIDIRFEAKKPEPAM